MPEGLTLSATARYAAFALLAIVGPGVALQRLCRVRVDPALVLPLGWAFCAGCYWLGLWLGLAWFPPTAALALDATLLSGRLALASGPPLRGALPPFLAVVLAFSLTEYGQNRPAPDGGFWLDGVLPDDQPSTSA